MPFPSPASIQTRVPDAPVHESQLPKMSDGHLYVFGHYWMSGSAEPLSPHVACLDFSGAPGRPLTAYRYDGEDQFIAGRFVQV